MKRLASLSSNRQLRRENRLLREALLDAEDTVRKLSVMASEHGLVMRSEATRLTGRVQPALWKSRERR